MLLILGLAVAYVVLILFIARFLGFNGLTEDEEFRDR